MKTTLTFLLSLSILAPNGVRAESPVTILHAGELLAVPGEATLKKQSLVIQDGLIREVRKGHLDAGDLSDEGEVIVIDDLADSFVLPGLIDMHVHLFMELGPKARTEGFFMEDSEATLRAAMYARRTLAAGFTTVRDAGSDPLLMSGLQAGIEKGYVEGPRILWSGWVGITGGHGDGSGYRDDIVQLHRSPTLCDGPYECRKATREAIRLGADWIKIAATGGVMTDTDTGTNQQMQTDELEAVVRAARAMGRDVAAHAHGTEGINAALSAGVASIEHGTLLDDESVRLFKESGAYYVPTMLAGHTVMEMAKNTDILPPNVAAKAREIGPMMHEAFQRAHTAGVKIAFGTDSAISPHGQNAREFGLMVEGGMSPEETIVSATVTAAEALGLAETIGTLERGKAADLIAVGKSPLEDVTVLTEVDFVMKGGEVVKSP